jgi:hypothetical protein
MGVGKWGKLTLPGIAGHQKPSFHKPAVRKTGLEVRKDQHKYEWAKPFARTAGLSKGCSA